MRVTHAPKRMLYRRYMSGLGARIDDGLKPSELHGLKSVADATKPAFAGSEVDVAGDCKIIARRPEASPVSRRISRPLQFAMAAGSRPNCARCLRGNRSKRSPW